MVKMKDGQNDSEESDELDDKDLFSEINWEPFPLEF